MLPKLPPRSSWEDMARAYGTMSEVLYEKWGEMAKDADEARAAALTASAVGHRAELVAQRTENAANELRAIVEPMRSTVERLKEALDRLTARLNGREIEARAKEASRPALEEVAASVASELQEKLEEFVEVQTGRFHIPPQLPPATFAAAAVMSVDSERVKEIVTAHDNEVRLDRYDFLMSNAVKWVLRVVGIGALFALERAIEAGARGHW